MYDLLEGQYYTCYAVLQEIKENKIMGYLQIRSLYMHTDK